MKRQKWEKFKPGQEAEFYLLDPVVYSAETQYWFIQNIWILSKLCPVCAFLAECTFTPLHILELGWFLSQFWRDCFFLVLVAPEHKLDDCLTSQLGTMDFFRLSFAKRLFLGWPLLIGFEKLVVMKSRDQNKEQKQNMWKTWKVELTSYKNMMNWQFDIAKPFENPS